MCWILTACDLWFQVGFVSLPGSQNPADNEGSKYSTLGSALGVMRRPSRLGGEQCYAACGQPWRSGLVAAFWPPARTFVAPGAQMQIQRPFGVLEALCGDSLKSGRSAFGAVQ